jgi:hypothetical protein
MCLRFTSRLEKERGQKRQLVGVYVGISVGPAAVAGAFEVEGSDGTASAPSAARASPLASTDGVEAGELPLPSLTCMAATRFMTFSRCFLLLR